MAKIKDWFIFKGLVGDPQPLDVQEMMQEVDFHNNILYLYTYKAFFCGFILKSWSHSCYKVSLETGTAATEACWSSTKDNVEVNASFEMGVCCK